MKIKYQLIKGYTKEDEMVLCSDKVYTLEAKPGESFETQRYYLGEPSKIRSVELRRMKSMIIPENAISDGSGELQPRDIRKMPDGRYELWYGWHRGKSWSQYSQCTDINIVELING
jgi:hypothetical protein